MNLRRALSQIALVTGTLLFSLGLQTYAQTWTPPTAPPPNADAYAPLTTGPTAQVKTGGLILGTGNALTALIVQNGRVGIGTTNPTARLDVAGEVKIGNSGLTCDNAKRGTVRYNQALDTLQYCATDADTSALPVAPGWRTFTTTSPIQMYQMPTASPPGQLWSNCTGQITSQPTCAWDSTHDDNGGSMNAAQRYCSSLGGSGYDHNYWDWYCTVPGTPLP